MSTVLNKPIIEGLVSVTYTEIFEGLPFSVPFDLDAHIAGLKIGKNLLVNKEENPTLDNITNKRVYAETNNPYEVYAYEASTDFDTKTVNIKFLGKFPNVEKAEINNQLQTGGGTGQSGSPDTGI